jgi:hypothetical protein
MPAELDPQVEAQLAEMSDAAWINLEARVRPPRCSRGENDGLEEAQRRGYIGDEGKPEKR